MLSSIRAPLRLMARLRLEKDGERRLVPLLAAYVKAQFSAFIEVIGGA